MTYEEAMLEQAEASAAVRDQQLRAQRERGVLSFALWLAVGLAGVFYLTRRRS